MDERLKSIEKELTELRSARNAIDWQRQILSHFPAYPDKNGNVVTILNAWLKHGPEVCRLYTVQQIQLVDRHPYYNDSREIWYYFNNHSEDQLDDDCEDYESPYNIPACWRQTVNRVDTRKKYHDDVGVSGWDTQENAEKALNRAAFRWAMSSEKE